LIKQNFISKNKSYHKSYSCSFGFLAAGEIEPKVFDLPKIEKTVV